MANLRTGDYGDYYGSLPGESEVLSMGEMNVNATYIYSSLVALGYTINAISAMLGNMQAESSINPGRWQNDNTGNSSLGYGLVQWTPSTKYTGWCTEQGLNDPSTMDSNLARIRYEVENNLQWIPTDAHNLTFAQFVTSTVRPSELAKAFLLNYERPADQSESVQNYRASLAEAWYTYLGGETPTEPNQPVITEKKKRKGYNFVIFNANRRRRAWIG